ncbi:CU044_2847 family protein [Streptomyces sp. NPDC012438]|uniref:CU044_2847 family protein n=1 Tax=Streptomyces sp. NPDC012438 TaxID=3364833 RepID=UPI0036EFC4C8
MTIRYIEGGHVAETVMIDLGDGTEVTAEVVGSVPFEQVSGRGEYGDVRFGQKAAEKLGDAVTMSLDQVRGTVQGLGRWAAKTIAEGDAGSPDAFEVEFGLKLAVKSGQLLGVIAEAGSEAALTVRLSWNLTSQGAQQQTVAQ